MATREKHVGEFLIWGLLALVGFLVPNFGRWVFIGIAGIHLLLAIFEED